MRNSGFSLLEVVLALGLLSFCIATLLGLMPAGVEDHRWAAEACGASSLLSSLHGDLGAAVGSGKERTDVFGIRLPQQGESLESELLVDQNGDPAAPGNQQACWRVRVRLRRAHAGTLLLGHLFVGWPARASDPADYAEAFLAFERRGQ